MQRGQTLFTQNRIAIIWDFDQTLIPGYMQKPLFEHFGVRGDEFWREVDELEAFYRDRGLELVSHDSMYLLHILTYVRHGIFKGLNNALLRSLGSQVEFFPGLPTFFRALQEHVASEPVFHAYDVRVEHYVVSTGLRQMILGSAIEPYLDDVWACEFVEDSPPPGYLTRPRAWADRPDKVIEQVGYAIDNTTKTRAIFEINKGTNKDRRIDVNAMMLHEDRRIPFENMIYVADGPSDVPVFSVINQRHGKTFAVYTPDSATSFRQAKGLQDQGRVQSFGPADYTVGSHTYLWLMATVEELASRIVETRSKLIYTRIHRPPTHITMQPDARVNGQALADEVEADEIVADQVDVDEPVAAEIEDGGFEDVIYHGEPVAYPVMLDAPDPSPLTLSALDTADQAASDADLVDEQTDQLVEICSEISANSSRPVTWRELNELRLYLGGRIGARPAGGQGSDEAGHADLLTREEVEAQLAMIRARSD
jgi:hypothetical protein